MPCIPYVKALRLLNFKGVVELKLDLHESLTLLAGVNGAGKTSVLQALLAAVTEMWRLRPPHDYPRFPVPEGVVRAGTSETEIALEVAAPGRLAALGQHPMEARLAFQEPGQRFNLTNDPLLTQFFNSIPSPLPLVVYYEQNRIVGPNSSGRKVSVSSAENRSSSLNTTISSPSEFKAWFFEKEADEGQETRERKDLGYEDPELAKIRKLLERLDGFAAVRSRKPADSRERTLFLEKDGADIPFDSLSGGEQAFFLLAADLARRLMLASPGTDVAEAPGIVCIDEIELHLHPAWQKRILTTLVETFPGCQFVVSTHSPQVISGVEAQHIRLLTPAEDGGREVSQPSASKGRDSNFILRGILDTPERDDDVSHLFDKFDRLVDESELEKAECVLGELDEVVEGQSSAVAIRRAKWNRLSRRSQ